MAENLSTLSSTGTEGSISGTGARYVLMSTWEAAQQTDLVDAGDTAVLECYDFVCEESATVNISGWTTNSSSFITVKSAAGEGPDGSLTAGFELRFFASFSLVLSCAQNYTVIENIRITNTANSGNAAQFFTVPNEQTVKNCVLNGGSSSGAIVATNAGTLKVISCLFYSTGTGATYMFNGGASYPRIVYNCTSIGGAAGIRSANTSTDVRNCVAFGAGSNDFSVSATSVSSTNNASGDTTAPGSLPQTGITTADYADYAGGDYSPAVGGKLDGTGADLSGDFTTDITGATRTVPWTIGAWITAGGPPPVGIQEMYIKDGGIFVKYTPHVKVGGTFQEVDAYVLEAGSWVPVHEK